MTESLCVLGVDDNPINLEILEECLEGVCEFHAVESGEDALEWLASRRADVVLLDIMMPGLNGYETCRTIRATPEICDVKVILVSARAMAQERATGFEVGADDYLTKPFDADELIRRVRTVAAGV